MDLRILMVAERRQADRVGQLLGQGLANWVGKGAPLHADFVLATDVREACVQFQAVPFDVVLMGLDAAGERSPGALDRLHEVEPDVPVIVFGSHTSKKVAESWRRAGAVDCVSCQPANVARVVERMVEATWEAWTRNGDVAEAVHEHHL